MKKIVHKSRKAPKRASSTAKSHAAKGRAHRPDLSYLMPFMPVV